MLNRREALHGLAAGLAAAEMASTAKATARSETVSIGAVGCGGRGRTHARLLAGRNDVRVAYVCEPDLKRAELAAAEVEKACGRRPVVVQDLRRVLDDPAVDAVTVATPDHWHAPAAILACQAGKHVYVENPCSHNVREGRLMIEAARRHRRVVQVGTQARQSRHVRRAMRLLGEGAIGGVLLARAWDHRRRADVGRVRPSRPPAPLNHDLWLGPAPYEPCHADRPHYLWYRRYAYGTGDLGNDGGHELDLALWGLGVDRWHPESVTASGAQLDDDRQFPDTRSVTFDFAPAGEDGRRKQVIFERRNWTPFRMEGYENGNAFYGTDGFLLLGRNDNFKLFGRDNELIEEMPADGTDTENTRIHHADFLRCVRSGRRPQADIEIGHYSAAACHLGNIASRLKRTLFFDGRTEQFIGDDDANKLLARAYRDGHWASLA